MANINEILARAAALRNETALNSIDPERAGGIMYDTLIALNELWLQQGAALVISKIYASVAAMQADITPVSDLTGQPIRPGQIVVIASSDADNGTVYRYNGADSPRWTAVGNIGDVIPVDSLNSDSITRPLAARQGKVLDEKIADLGQYTDSPEWLRVITDAEGKILYGVKTDGKFYFGAGCPPQVAFLLKSLEDDFMTLLNGKVDKESGKSLINADFANSQSVVESPEYLYVEVDAEGKILSVRLKDGRKFENCDFYAKKNLFIAEKLDLDGATESHEENPEWIEIKIDADGKILSGRKTDGRLVEKAGIETTSIIADNAVFKEVQTPQIAGLSDEGKQKLSDELRDTISRKEWYLPRFGRINIKEETFYLDASGWDSYANDVVQIQIYDDTTLNAQKRLSLSAFYIKSTLIPLPGGGYDRTSVTENSVVLELHAGKDVAKVGSKYFATTLYIPVRDGEYITDYTKVKASKVTDPDTGEVIGYTYNGESTEVKQVKDTPPYKVWKVNKNVEHYCLADIDFGSFYTKNDDTISIKYQGSGSTMFRQRGLRLTFYKNNKYEKKAKVKIGEMVRLSGFNMKSYGNDSTRVKDPVFSYIFIDMWEERGHDCYPWDKRSVPYNGATGMIKSFPIGTWFGEEFFGLQSFSLKKDGKNYMLDDNDDASGIFVNGEKPSNPRSWIDASHNDWTDELEAVEPMSQSTADALDMLFLHTRAFVDGVWYKDSSDNYYNAMEVTGIAGRFYLTSTLVDGQIVPESVEVTEEAFDNSAFEEHADLASWIDYWIGLVIFQLWDNTYRNIVLYSGPDKSKFYMFFYDLDGSMYYNYNDNFIERCITRNVDMSFWSKFASVYKDSIVNRYAELRKNVLAIKNFKSIYQTYVGSIPFSVITQQVARWGDGNPATFEELLTVIENRLDWLDGNYFNISNFN